MSSPVVPMTVPLFREAKAPRVKPVVVTAYDYTSARFADEAGVDAVLVGDSLGMVVQGHATSLPVTLRQMAYHTACVARGTSRALVITDLPFGSYQASPAQAVRSAVTLLKAGAAAVKLEGGVRMIESISAIIRADIPVMGHIGLTPQSVHRMGGFKVQRDRDQLLQDAKALEEAGVFSIVVEGVPTELGHAITNAVSVPTIGIGAGPGCDGQVLVWHDLLGLWDAFQPKFAKRYATLSEVTREALRNFCHEVRTGAFPTEQHGYKS